MTYDCPVCGESLRLPAPEQTYDAETQFFELKAPAAWTAHLDEHVAQGKAMRVETRQTL
jgi:hypothetical protein